MSAEEARQIAEAEHRRVREEHPEWRLSDLFPTFATYNTAYVFQCANGQAQLEGYVPGMWSVSVDRVDVSIGTDQASKDLHTMMHSLIYGL